MAIVLVAISILLRYVSFHSIIPALKDWPIVPLTTALMILAFLVDLVRRQVKIRFMPHWLLQWLLFGWACISLLVNEGPAATSIFSTNYFRDLVYVTMIFLIVDRIVRLKIFVIAVCVSLILVGIFALPQTWGERMCAEWQEGDQSNIKFDGRPCQQVNDCFINQPKERLIPGIGARLYRCERRGLFDIGAFIGRIHWVGVFHDSNNLAGGFATIVPLIIAWLWRPQASWLRFLWPLLAIFFAAAIFATGSRGGQLALLAGLGLTLWGLWGKKALYVGAFVGLLMIVVLLSVGKLRVREDNHFEGSTDVSDQFRREAMSAGFRLWTSYPFFGVGHMRFDHYHLIDPHNAYLATAGELGTPGLLIFAFSLWALIKGTWQVRTAARQAGHMVLERLAYGQLGSLGAAFISLTLFLSTYDKLSWLMLVASNIGLLRTAQKELPQLRLSFNHWDIVAVIPAILLFMGLLYLGLSISYTIS